MSEKTSLHSGRVVCPACGRKGVGYAAHPHAFGWKDFDHATCRYCKKRFKVKDKIPYSDHDREGGRTRKGRVMKYRISRTSIRMDDAPPCEGAFREMVPHWDARTFKTPEEHDARIREPWLSSGTDHGKWSGGIIRRLEDRPAWFIEADSIEALVEEFGTLVVKMAMSTHPDRPEMEIEIYDDYRE